MVNVRSTPSMARTFCRSASRSAVVAVRTFDEHAVFPRDGMTFLNLGKAAQRITQIRTLEPVVAADAHERTKGQAECLWIEFDAEPSNHSGLLQLFDPLKDGGRGEMNLFTQIGVLRARVFLQQG